MKGISVKTTPRVRSSGFTIVELMVGMVVGLIATVVMFQVFAVSEGQKRTTTGAGDAQQNGVGSVFLIERDARMAGFGISLLPVLGCWVNGFYEPANQPFSFRLAPYEIRDGGATPDQLTIVYGDTRNFSAPERVSQDMPTPQEPFKVYNRYGFALGDVFIVAEPGQPCSMFQVGQLLDTDRIGHDPGPFVDSQGRARRTEFNRGAGIEIQMPAYSSPILYKKWVSSGLVGSQGARLMNVGQRPKVITYALQGNQLTMRDTMLPGEPPIVLADGIVQFQVQYAFDANGDQSVPQESPSRNVLDPTFGDQWADSLPANPTNAMWRGIVGIRFVIVSRSMTPERPDPATGICNVTTANPVWLAANRPLDITTDPNWRCYRYRTFEVTVPARNLMWLPDDNA